MQEKRRGCATRRNIFRSDSVYLAPWLICNGEVHRTRERERERESVHTGYLVRDRPILRDTLAGHPRGSISAQRSIRFVNKAPVCRQIDAPI